MVSDAKFMHSSFPKQIKQAAIALIISLISSLIAVYVDGLAFEEMGFNDPWILGTNIIWALVIAWIIWDLFKGKKGIPITLILVGLIMLVALIWDYIEFGFSLAQVFYAIEILLFIVTYYFVMTPQSKAWFANKQSAMEDQT